MISCIAILKKENRNRTLAQHGQQSVGIYGCRPSDTVTARQTRGGCCCDTKWSDTIGDVTNAGAVMVCVVDCARTFPGREKIMAVTKASEPAI